VKQATFASKVEVNGKDVSVTREVDGGLEIVKAPLPAIITADLRSITIVQVLLLTLQSESAPIRDSAEYHEGQEKATDENDAAGSGS
jgi:electron transfer flavoprotein alpha/beta subunit